MMNLLKLLIMCVVGAFAALCTIVIVDLVHSGFDSFTIMSIIGVIMIMSGLVYQAVCFVVEEDQQ